MSPTQLKQRWKRDDVLGLLGKTADFDAIGLVKAKKEYPGLLHHATDQPRLHRDYHWIVFNENEPLDISDEQLEFLVGPEWRKERAKYVQSIARGIEVLDRNGFTLDLSNVASQYAMSDVNLLSQGQGVKVVSSIDNSVEDLAPAVNFAIACTTVAVKRQEPGIMLWQQKEQLIQSAGAPDWDRVPDVMYHDYNWTEMERQKFINATYAQKRDFLCARFRMQNKDVVLPFVLDFPGRTLLNPSDARVTAEIDGITAPAAAISIPGSAFVGWFSDMVPDFHNQADFRKAFRTETNTRNRREFVLSTANKEAMRVKTVEEMWDRIKEMFGNPVSGSLCYYEHIRRLMQIARA